MNRRLFSDKVWDAVIKTVKELYGISEKELLEKCRKSYLVDARMVAMLTYKEITHDTLEVTGERFHRDHATIYFAIRKAKGWYGKDRKFTNDYNLFNQKLTEHLQ